MLYDGRIRISQSTTRCVTQLQPGCKSPGEAMKNLQLDRQCRGWEGRRWVKRQTHKTERKAARLLLEDAPRRHQYRGYCS